MIKNFVDKILRLFGLWFACAVTYECCRQSAEKKRIEE